MNAAVVKHRNLKHVLREVLGHLVRVTDLDESFQE
jgi:hypothetical protein